MVSAPAGSDILAESPPGGGRVGAGGGLPRLADSRQPASTTAARHRARAVDGAFELLCEDCGDGLEIWSEATDGWSVTGYHAAAGVALGVCPGCARGHAAG